MSEQGGYVYGQVRFAEVCDLVSRKKSLESSGHQPGVRSETLQFSVGLRAGGAEYLCLLFITALVPGEEGRLRLKKKL